ncbi:unnamed protein product [Parnassius mnemosyne]|uniref:Odorant receptor n=1 Tax=Parnassius mnemosyne TaxID=213953 RepID=A0AAV1KF77_9NEOP
MAHRNQVSPLDLQYIKQVIFSLSVIDSWPHKEMNSKNPIPFTNNKFLFVLILIVWTAELIYIRNNIGVLSFLIMGHTYITALLAINCLLRITLPWTKMYRYLIVDFIHKIHLYHYKNKSDFAGKMFTKIHNISSYFSKFLHYQIYFGVILFNVTPLVHNARAGLFFNNSTVNITADYELSIYYEIPFDIESSVIGYVFVFIFNFFFSLITTSIMCVDELFISLIIIHIWGHLKILENNLIHFPRPKTFFAIDSLHIQCAFYTKDESIMVKELLIEHIIHHRMIANFISRTTEVFGPTLCLYYVFQQISECIVLCECSTMDTEVMGKYIVLAIVLFQQLIQISVVFEKMCSMGKNITDAVYGLPWECMNVENQKLVLFFLQNVQVPINIKALNMVTIGVQTMAAILKTSFSYFVMLRAIAFD